MHLCPPISRRLVINNRKGQQVYVQQICHISQRTVPYRWVMFFGRDLMTLGSGNSRSMEITRHSPRLHSALASILVNWSSASNRPKIFIPYEMFSGRGAPANEWISTRKRDRKRPGGFGMVNGHISAGIPWHVVEPSCQPLKFTVIDSTNPVHPSVGLRWSNGIIHFANLPMSGGAA